MFFFYKLAQYVMMVLPRRTGYWLAGRVADLYYFFSRTDKKKVMENLKAIFEWSGNPWDEKSLSETARLVFRNFAKYLADFFTFHRVNKKYLDKFVKIENRHYLDEVLAQRKGAIGLSAHLGSWELGAVVLATLGYPINAVVLPHQERLVERFFVKQRSVRGIKVIPLVGLAIRKSFSVLREGKMLALLGDRVFSEKGINLNFFGKPALFPRGPAVFHIRCGSPILPAFMIRESDDSFKFVFEKPINYQASGDAEKDIIRVTEECRRLLEDYIRRYPEQWYMFNQFWLEKS